MPFSSLPMSNLLCFVHPLVRSGRETNNVAITSSGYYGIAIVKRGEELEGFQWR